MEIESPCIWKDSTISRNIQLFSTDQNMGRKAITIVYADKFVGYLISIVNVQFT